MKDNRVQQKNSHPLELIAIAVLTLLLIVMFTQYCLLKNAGHYSGLPKLDLMHGDFSGLYAPSAQEEDGLLFPAFIGIVSEGYAVAPLSAETRSALMKTARPYLLTVFSGSASYPDFSSETARLTYIDRELYGSRRCLYLSFSRELPAAAIYPALTGSAGMTDAAQHTYGVKELFIFCSDFGAVSGAAIDEKGNVILLSVPERTALSFDSLAAYSTDPGMGDFSFAELENRRYPVYNTSVSRRNLAAYNNNGDFLSKNSKDTSSILQSFGFNPNNTRYYVTRNRYITYVEDMGEIRISSEGNLTFTGTGGIPISSLCGRRTAGSSFEKAICAAYRVLGSLDAEYYGGDASFSLASAVYQEDRLTLSFDYTVAGIPIEASGNAAVFTFAGETLVSASLRARSFLLLESTFSDIPQKLLFTVILTQPDAELPVGFSPVYTREDEDSVYSARYAFTYDRENSADRRDAS